MLRILLLPQFYSNKKRLWKPPHNMGGGGFRWFKVSSSFSSLPFLALVFHLSIRFLTFEALKWPTQWGHRRFHLLIFRIKWWSWMLPWSYHAGSPMSARQLRFLRLPARCADERLLRFGIRWSLQRRLAHVKQTQHDIAWQCSNDPIYIWLVTARVPTFFASKPIYHSRLAQKMAFFFTQILRKKKRCFLTLEIYKTRTAPHFAANFILECSQTPCFIVFSRQHMGLTVVMSIMSLMFCQPVPKKCLKRW